MKHHFNEDRSHLIITADEEERVALRELREEQDGWGTIRCECEALEHLLANSELQWIDPSDTGDLTDAPILGILGDDQREHIGPYGSVKIGQDRQGGWYAPILERWGYMPYALRSFLNDLVDDGKAVFVNSN
jgi:hypothetical protein